MVVLWWCCGGVGGLWAWGVKNYGGERTQDIKGAVVCFFFEFRVREGEWSNLLNKMKRAVTTKAKSKPKQL